MVNIDGNQVAIDNRIVDADEPRRSQVEINVILMDFAAGVSEA